MLSHRKRLEGGGGLAFPSAPFGGGSDHGVALDEMLSMTQRHGDSIGGIFLWYFGQAQANADHLLNLLFGSPPRARDGFLYLLGRVFVNRQSMSGNGRQGDATGVSENQCASSISMLKDALGRGFVGSIFSNESLEAIQENCQSLRKGRGISEHEDAIVDVSDSTTSTFDKAPPAQPSAWVDA